ncbi:DUF2255 family protein [Sphingobacterium sp. UME9]|uniref:DUF2255 family protein n=1 Tax=Sphingobacterium sp. UME9 TaxID=1862316 RepID=UPI001603AFDA|nr:DUF2255 family protein [Sphingobacterium sp. UME9]MBB1642856.1 hypothetical protein [Sphingobacterium sp. UME9]
MNGEKKFPVGFYKYLEENTLVEIKSGENRTRFTEIWMVIVDERVFARSWNKNQSGWMNEFLTNKVGMIKFGAEIIDVTVRKLGDNHPIHQKINQAYLEKYTQDYNLEYANEISLPEYAHYTIEFFPAAP